jgi:hypothetical protein
MVASLAAQDPIADRIAQGNLPAATNNTKDPKTDQGPTSSCTAHALVKGVEILIGFFGSMHVLYGLTGQRQGDLSDDGRQLSDNIIVAITQGLAPFEGDVEGRHSDISTANATTPPTFEETKAALEHKFQLLQLRIDPAVPGFEKKLIATLALGSSIYLGTQVGSAFENLGNGMIAQPDPANDTSGGGHALLIVGHRTNADGTYDWLIQNSWGETWDENGECWASTAWVVACWELHPLLLATPTAATAAVVEALEQVK